MAKLQNKLESAVAKMEKVCKVGGVLGVSWDVLGASWVV